jgi:hypothetical protein
MLLDLFLSQNLSQDLYLKFALSLRRFANYTNNELVNQAYDELDTLREILNTIGKENAFIYDLIIPLVEDIHDVLLEITPVTC